MYENGTPVLLGDDGPGYPPQLYPNLTYGDPPSDNNYAHYGDLLLDNNATLLLGPLFLKSNSSLLSLTVPHQQ
jgi:osomolarity two-component system sensor histidine kinase SLN1